MMTRLATPVTLGLIWALGLCLLACSGGVPGPDGAAVDAPDILVVVLDTVRRDRLATYGYPRETSPRFDALGLQSRLFHDAYATSSWTPPSHASIFTGLYPIRHGTTQEHWALRGDFDTLAEILGATGYETGGVSGNVMLSRKLGFDQGFETYHESWRGVTKSERDPTSVAWIEGFLASRSKSRPLFLFVNLIGAHTPYDSCGASCGAFGAALDGGIVDSRWREYYPGRVAFSPADFDRLNRLYDAEVLEVDAHLGHIVDAFDRHASRENPVIVVTSDHGENIGEHRHVNHVFSLYQTTIRIPLLIRAAAHFEAGSADRRAVQLVDLFPTILHAAGIPLVDHASHGIDLIGESDAHRAIITEYYRPVQALSPLLESATADERQRLSPFWRRIRTVSQDGWKLHWGSDGGFELYHLTEDPHEARDLIDTADGASRKARLLERLQGFTEGYQAADDGSDRQVDPEPMPILDEATEAELRALGYID